MADPKDNPTVHQKLDRPSENLATKDTAHAPWHDDLSRNSRDTSKHRRYHSLFEDLMN